MDYWDLVWDYDSKLGIMFHELVVSLMLVNESEYVD